ncbi:MAG: low specificity L-threonine aldolase [Alphaproteobacteria bacterium]|nr:low specificity L-threonine aldolase [Alphaproteobacteria bacterium]
MNFCSDNVSGVSPEILSALTTANNGPAMPYGADEVTARVVAGLRALFEAPAAEIVLMSTGSSANALALATMTPPFAAVYCHSESHVNVDECGAPEFYTGGAKLVPVEGQHAKMSVEALESAITGAGVVHHVQPAAVSVTQVTEAGTLYTLEELWAISDICKRHELKLHMDGARFANAIEALGCTPAACSHELGVDALSFGATKNGAMCAEAILFFDPVLAREAGYRRKRAGHLFSKMRFLSAQFDAYLADDLWRRNARHANAMAARLAAGLEAIPDVEFASPVEANELFVRLPVAVIKGLLEAGFLFYRWEPDGTLIRMVTAFDTEAADVEAFIEAVQRLAG